MPSYIITVKPSASDSELAQIKQDILNQGGKITSEYTILRGFACDLPEKHYSTYATHPSVQSVEADGVVTTQ
ncbi:hypothetical protein B9Z19DRAFT_1137872 [Tuber borchii]|uniref:Inhibitor I9 domain-containing protein n=1 Tax=Tuber borchii TaxID=42251 RepID=A0A2T6ZA69_TUBBO|nr:hypothetical protein B9Z19DRAFT_1137872 [Tuber borchii]